MEQRLIIHGQLPGRNEWIKADRRHWAEGGKLKKQATELVAWEAAIQHIKPVEKCHITIQCFEPDMRRDSDNVVSGAIKPILDGLKLARIIKDDSRKYVNISTLPVELDRENPRIEVWIEVSE
jgi:Holliday junction resolvase RusA-like endonuclease